MSTKYERTPERWTLGSTIEEKNTSCIQTAERRAETTCFGVAFTCVETKTFVLGLFRVPTRHSLSKNLVLQKPFPQRWERTYVSHPKIGCPIPFL
jgi:hypothetical protein